MRLVGVEIEYWIKIMEKSVMTEIPQTEMDVIAPVKKRFLLLSVEMEKLMEMNNVMIEIM